MMHRNAITRIEVAVLVGLGALVAGLLVVLLARQRENGRRVKCMNNLRRIGEAAQSFHMNSVPAVDGKPGLGAFLPPARIAEAYGTWAVLLVPHLAQKHPLSEWDQSQTYLAQKAAVREALLTEYFCPARSRPGWLSTHGEIDPATGEHVAGGLGDYAGVAGSGDPARPWDGPNADGAIIVGEVLDRHGDRIVRWRGRIGLAAIEAGRGQSETLLFGEKHVPPDCLGDARKGDGSLYDGDFPAGSTRVAGPGFGLAADVTDPFNHNFGSGHPGLSQFLFADGSVRPFTFEVDEKVLGELARREK